MVTLLAVSKTLAKDILFDPGTDNVGIGTTNPGAKLDVAGNVNIDGSSAYLYDGVQALKLAKGTDTYYANTMVGYLAGYLNSGTYQTVLGMYAGAQNTAYYQTALGYRAGYQNSGLFQTALGYLAGYQNTGSHQTAVGSSAGNQNTGTYQTTIGYLAGYQNAGDRVIGIGYEATRGNTVSADDVVAIGYQAGKDNTVANQFIVKQASVNSVPLIQGDFSSGNVGIATTTPQAKLHIIGGVKMSNLDGSYRVPIEDTELVPKYYVDENFAPITAGPGSAFLQGGNSFGTIAVLGTNDAYNLDFITSSTTRMTIDTSGNVGIAIITPSYKLDVNGNVNIAEGKAYKQAGYDILKVAKGTDTYYANTMVGQYAGNPSSQRQTALGYNAGNQNAGSYQTALGYAAGYQNSGSYQTALGYAAGYSNTGHYQTAIGSWTGHSNTGNYQTALGYAAGQSNAGDRVIGIGYEATSGNTATADDVVAIGYQAGKDNTVANQFIVKQANINAVPLIQGDFSSGNVGINDATPTYRLDVNGTGRFTSPLTIVTPTASNHATTKSYVDSVASNANTLDGLDSASFLRSNANDTFTATSLTLDAGAYLTTRLIGSLGTELGIGAGEMWSTMNGNISGESLWLGGESGVKIVSSPDNMGSGWTGRHEATLVNTAGNSTFPGDVTAAAFYYNSDKRLKDNIVSLGNESLDVIDKLNPVSFTWKEDGSASQGFIAQEVEQVLPELVKTNNETDMKSVQYGNLTAVLTAGIKAQQEKINDLETELEILKLQVNSLKNN
jgi:hypothetical protein